MERKPCPTDLRTLTPAAASVHLDRTTFCTRREMDFFCEKELVAQTGHDVRDWPMVIGKELIDNALDACEERDEPPIIEVSADASGIMVRDNGPGLPETTLKAALNFTVRASSREAYVSPCRGAQGNALKTLFSMPYVIDPDAGRLVVTTQSKQHIITCRADPVSQRVIIHDEVGDPKSKNQRPHVGKKKQAFSCGTAIRIEWAERPEGLWPFGGLPPCRDRFCALVQGFAVFNPHATIRLDWFGQTTAWSATDIAWRKWKPHNPTSPHWYEPSLLERLIAAYITYDRDNGKDRLVSEFVAEFDGLSGSAKRTKVLAAAGMKRTKLSELVQGKQLDSARIGKLLFAMQANTKPVRCSRLGIVGEEHLRAQLLAMGVQPESFRYCRKTSDAKSKKLHSAPGERASFLPWVLETAFGWLGEDAIDRRRIFAGANWSAAIKNPFRSFGATGQGLETVLAEQRATRMEPVVVVVHLAHPRLEYTDRGKTALVIGGAA